jgi:DNA-binding transcriptional LysR family regulator
LVADDLAAGRLERVFHDELLFAGRLLAVYPTRKYLTAKVRSFLDFIARDPRMK